MKGRGGNPDLNGKISKLSPESPPNHPGYGSNSKMTAGSAFCLLKNPDLAQGGIWTHAAAMGSLLPDRRVRNAGLTFEVEQTCTRGARPAPAQWRHSQVVYPIPRWRNSAGSSHAPAIPRAVMAQTISAPVG